MRKLLLIITIALMPLFAQANFVEIREFVNEFIADSHGKFTDRKQLTPIYIATLEYSDKGYGVIGLCYWGLWGSQRRIELDQVFLDTQSRLERKALVYHELGHCACNRDHTDYIASWLVGILDKAGVDHVRAAGYYPDGCPRSLMHPFNVGYSCLATHWDQYKVELFKQCNPPLDLSFPTTI